jgi:hypothetical protein
MNKLRIVSQEHCGQTIYKVQRKKWYGWLTEYIYKFSGMCVDMSFETIEEAELYIVKNFTKPKIKVVKNLNVK